MKLLTVLLVLRVASLRAAPLQGDTSPEGITSPESAVSAPSAQAQEAPATAEDPGSETLQVSYQIDARLSEDLRRLDGHIRITIRSGSPLEDLQILLFPEHLSTASPRLDDLTAPRVFPGAFSPAGMSFAPTRDGRLLEVRSAPLPPGWKAGTLISVPLEPPLKAGEPTTIEGDFHVLIPRRYGLFGAAHGQLTLAGGWYPLVVARRGSEWAPQSSPPLASVKLTLHQRSPLVPLLEGQLLAPTECPGQASEQAAPADQRTSNRPTPADQRDSSRAERCSSASIQARIAGLVAGRYRAYPLKTEIPIILYDTVNRPQERRQLAQLVDRALLPWRAAGLPLPVKPAPLIRAPLRRTLGNSSEGMVLLSDRGLRIFPLVRRFHAFPVVHTLYESWLREARADVETSDDQRWVNDGLAWQLVDVFRLSLARGDLDVKDILRPLSFIPVFDQMLYAPSFAFAGEIYGNPYVEDLLRESVADYLRPESSGRVLMMKLEDQFGKAPVRGAGVAALTGSREPFAALLAARSEADVAEIRDFVTGWRRPYPRVDYRIERVRRLRRDKQYVTSFTLSRIQIDGGAPTELVPVRVSTTKAHLTYRWEVSGVRRVTVTTGEPVVRIVVDPERRLRESGAQGENRRADNYWPRRVKSLVSVIPGSLDLSLVHPQGIVAVYLTNPDNRNLVGLVELYSDSQVRLGSSLGAFRYFGRFRDAQWRTQRTGVQLVVGNRSGSAFYGPEAADEYLDTFGLRMSYRYESRKTLHDNRTGRYFYAGFEEGLARTREDSHLYSVISLATIQPWAIHPRHVLFGRVNFDAGFGLEGTKRCEGSKPCIGLFTLGGGSALRALTPGEAVGNQRWLVSLEYRALVLEGLDVNLGAARLRSVQLAAFTDIGAVGNQLSDLERPYLGYGVGVRFFADWLGLWPGIVGLDTAWLAGGGRDFRTLLRLSQPF